MKKIVAVILAAGRGKRMGGAEGSEVKKELCPVLGRPMIEYVLDNIKGAGVDRVVLIVGYKRELMRKQLGDCVEYAVQEEQLGTGHATMQARKKLEGVADAVIVCNGDMPLVSSETIKNLISVFEKERPTIAMLTVVSTNPEFLSFGRIVRGEDGFVASIIEQKDCTEEELHINEYNPAFYIFDGDWLWSNLKKISTNNTQSEYYLTDIIKIARDQGKKIVAVKVENEDEVFGINTQEQLKIAEQLMAK